MPVKLMLSVLKKRPKVYVIGAGVTGLSTAYFLAKSGQYQVVVLEKEARAGGMALTFKRGGLLLDLGPHKLFSNLLKRQKEVLVVLGSGVLKIKKQSKIRLLNQFVDFPVGPVDVLKINLWLGLKMGLSFGLASLGGKKKERSYQDYLVNRFGRVTYDLTFGPYAKKIWAEPSGLDKELAATRVVAPSLLELVKQMVFKVKSDKVISADSFYYPQRGSGVFCDRLVTEIRKNGGQVRLRSGVSDIKVKNKKVVSFRVSGRLIKLAKNEVLISTMPLENVTDKAKKLKYKNMILAFVVLKKNMISRQNWYFFPESKYIFNRVFEQKSFSKFMIPSGKTVLCCEITCDAKDPIWDVKDDKETLKKVVGQLEECDLIRSGQVATVFTKRMERAYPIYEIGFRKKLFRIFKDLDGIDNFYSVGRQGGFNYVGMIDCFDIGAKTASYVLGESEFSNRRDLRQSFFDYVVID